jgi:hypothetical protein
MLILTFHLDVLLATSDFRELFLLFRIFNIPMLIRIIFSKVVNLRTECTCLGINWFSFC